MVTIPNHSIVDSRDSLFRCCEKDKPKLGIVSTEFHVTVVLCETVLQVSHLYTDESSKRGNRDSISSEV